jgi:hypothetical protein
MDQTMLFHILTATAAAISIVVGLKGFFPKSVSDDVKLLKQESESHKKWLERIENKVDDINAFLRKDKRQ